MHPTASGFTQFGIGGLSALVFAGLFVALPRARREFAAWGVWIAAVGVAALLGVFRLANGAPLTALMAGSLGLAIWLGRRVEVSAPLWVVIGVQAFRLPLELVMHTAANEGTMPSALSFNGYNFDIVTGATALLVGVALKFGAPRGLAWAWWGLSTSTLAAIVVIAVATAPMLRLLGEGQVNTWVGYVPFVWLPSVLVVAAVAGQVVLWRALTNQVNSPISHG